MKENFEEFITRFKDRLHDLFHNKTDIDNLSLSRGLPEKVWSEIMALKPLSVAVPEQFGGRGLEVKECLSVLSAASYEALPLSLTFGINIALFLEPFAKYSNDAIKPEVYNRFINHGAMGGLMITEPDYGSDALSMQTSNVLTEEGYALKGQKHWQGLTGMADYWLVTSRKKNDNGDLARDIDFFVTDESKPEQKINVENYFNNLGLYMIPYGLNNIDLKVPANQKLEAPRTGIKMMLDILHRSRLQFPGMGMGFIKRMLDEAIEHCTNRIVGGQSLLHLDSVKFQISRIQAAYSLCSGMCARSSSMSGIDFELSGQGLEANSMKALVTDMMQESAQLCTQLSGSSGYKLDHIAGRGIVDSRPFQIFEGSNEMLYTQIAEVVTKQMKRLKETKLGKALSEMDRTSRIAPMLKKQLDFNLPDNMVQRQMVVLGQVVARMVSLQYVSEMVDKGFRNDLFDNCFKHMSMDITRLLSDFIDYNNAEPIVAYNENSDWMNFI
ncbi:acyl-CoA dehydrogenase family protein [Neptunitalea lumnitzerae]|uniref:Acyl-CoA dehydrogenase n=1 Tax=Neptunitalea lumnitzerae TaxID=2965509 RepID=A0ABQ5MIS2_9FLAO|nr:acyl-CoA dehydrogenase family protein [Neptunitalea sp. Y10]GLB49313.1 acyl-CoA dehydrogenase [Neptunitalea sp. Y10]